MINRYWELELAGILCCVSYISDAWWIPRIPVFLKGTVIVSILTELILNGTYLVLVILPHLKHTRVTNKHYVMPSDFALIQIDFNGKGQPFLFLRHSETFCDLELPVSPNLSPFFFFSWFVILLSQTGGKRIQ
jgi:hypothetical protein